MIEIVGLATRVPGARNKTEFWQLLKQEKCSVTEIPEDRWSKFHYYHPRQNEPGKSYSFAAGVLNDAWRFDPSVFGVSPREAEQMDPQQRILLETTWEAIEDAGIAPGTIAGENVGVYVGSSGLDYANQNVFDPASATGHFMTGNTLSIIANRLSYIFDLKGPSFTVDTACSSSLVALNEAFAALSSGKLDTAIVAGVNFLGSPFPFVGFAQATMLSPDGLCRAFDENALGYVRSEGCLVLILRRKDVEPWLGQRAYADIVAVDTNSDGRTVGMSMPSSTDQAALLERIYRDNGIDKNALVFLEAHGTGTRVGDPIEATAVGEILGKARSRPLPIGSVKTNIGHLEPASGLAGVVKAVLALENDYLPASLHFDKPNPDIDFDALKVEVVANGRRLARTEKRRYAGVNSFGFGGTNAHVIVADPAPRRESAASGDEEGRGLLMLSAQTDKALQELAGSYVKLLEGAASERIERVSRAAFHRKPRFRQSLMVPHGEPSGMTKTLAGFADHGFASNAVHGAKKISGGPCVFVFSGNGGQWPGMGQEAYQRNADFRESFQATSDLFEPYRESSLVDLLFADDLDEQLKKTSVAQPLIFAVQVALSDALLKAGLMPQMTVGHSIGEVAAAVVACKITRAEAVRLVHVRSHAQEMIEGSGTMGALVLSEEEAASILLRAGFVDLEIAAINSHKSVTISGSHEDMVGFTGYARGERVAFKQMDLNYPFHSSLVDDVETPFRKEIGAISGVRSDIAMISTVTGDLIEGDQLNAEYWWQNLRQPVRFADSIRRASLEGAQAFLEIGPKPILQSYIKQEILKDDKQSAVLGSLKGVFSDDADVDPIMMIVAEAIVAGVDVDKCIVFGTNPPEALALPGYPWQHREFRFSETQESFKDWMRTVENPLLGWRANSNSTTWFTHLDPLTLPFLADHVVDNQIIFPGSGYLEMALEVARIFYGAEVAVEVHTLDIISAIRLSDQYLMEVQTAFNPETRTIEISSRRRGGDDSWSLNARGRVSEAINHNEVPSVPHIGPGHVVVSGPEIYDLGLEYGLAYGPAFQRVKLITRQSGQILRVHLKSQQKIDPFGIHPAELDACFHGLMALFGEAETQGEDKRAFVPIFFDQVQQFKAGCEPAFADIAIRKASPQSILADFKIFDANDQLLLFIRGGRFRATNFALADSLENLVYRTEARISDDAAASSALVEFDLPSFADVNERLSAKEFTFDGEERESRLLLLAAAQRMATDVCQALMSDGERISIDRLPETATPFFQTCLLIAEENGELVNEGGDTYKFLQETELPDFEVLVRSIIDEAPEEIAAAVLLSHARREALKLIDDETTSFKPSGALLDHFKFSSPDALARTAVVSEWAACFIEKWPEERPLRILDLAGAGVVLSRKIRQDFPGRAIKFTIVDPDPASAARLSASMPPSDTIGIIDVSKGWDALNDLSFDLVLSCGRLHEFDQHSDYLKVIKELLADDGVLIATENMINPIYDMGLGLTYDWFAQSLVGELPISPQKSTSEWETALQDAGFVKATGSDRVINGFPLSVLTARKPSSDVQTKDHVVDLDGEHWTIFIGENDLEQQKAQELADSLLSAGATVEMVFHPHAGLDDDPVFRNDAESCWTHVRESKEFGDAKRRILVHFSFPEELNPAPFTFLSERCLSTIEVVKAMKDLSADLVFVVPNGSALSPDSDTSAIQHALWSFARVVLNEAPHLTVRVIDVDDTGDKTATKIIDLVHMSNRHAEHRAEEGKTLHPHVVRDLPPSSRKIADAVSLSFDRPGSLDGLKWIEKTREPLGDNEVEIEVVASGLNFRDVMWALGMLPEEALEDGYGGAAMGLECSGRISRTGRHVTGLKEGDPVVAFTSNGFSNYVKVPAFAVAKVPEGQDLTAAATIPVAFLTAFYSLIHLGGLKKGQWLLLHGAAGGVGLAALQIAKWADAKVIATAGSDEKRELLRVLGADHVLNSRSLDFAEAVKKITGDGVHLVLNSLAGEAMERGIGALRPFGRFLELGKRDYYGNTKIGLRPFRCNISYFGIDVDQLLLHEKELARDLIGHLFSLINDGTFVPLPYRIFDGGHVEEAFRLMQRSGQIGKILVRPPELKSVTVARKAEKIVFAQHGAHVVVGGLGGFGGEIAKWLADNGAKTIILTSRSGVPSDAHKALMARFAERNVNIRCVACDVTNYKAVDDLLKSLREEMPIKSIIHAAMVIDDGAITSLTRDRFERVLAPKVAGAHHLNQLTWQDNLDHFILFSSATTLVGNPGQAHYVAANGYLEGLARERRRAGRSGIAVGWGAIGDVGFLARNQKTSEKLSRQLGEAMISAREGLDILEKAIMLDDESVDNAVLYIGKLDWTSAASALPILKTQMFDGIVRSLSSDGDAVAQIDLKALVSGKDEDEARQVIAELLTSEIGTILRIPVDEIEKTRPLAELGMDSLMGLELRMTIQNRFDLEIPLFALSGTTNLTDVAALVLKSVHASDDTGDDAVGADKRALANQHLSGDISQPDLGDLDDLLEKSEKKVKTLMN